MNINTESTVVARSCTDASKPITMEPMEAIVHAYTILVATDGDWATARDLVIMYGVPHGFTVELVQQLTYLLTPQGEC